MKTRVRLLVAVSVALVAGATLIVALSTGGRHHDSSGLVTINVAKLHPGDVLITHYTASVTTNHELQHHVPVVVVDVPREGVIALVGRSTHLGCRVEWVHAADYRRFEHQSDVTFEDPCGGSLFALNGDCLGGPCPRALDRFSATEAGTTLSINLSDIKLGRKRPPTAQLDPG